MLVISWNMGCAPHQSRYRKTHGEAWEYLLGTLQPDVCLVQEALLSFSAPEPYAPLIWSLDKSSDSGTAVVVRGGIHAEPLSFSCEGSYVAGVRIRVREVPTVFQSIHVGPPKYKKNLRLLAAFLSETLAEVPFVVGGDLNAARHVDDVYGGRWFARYFDELIASGLHDCHWAHHGREVQSFWGQQARNHYQCDHLFVDRSTAPLIAECTVIDNRDVRFLSDHGPLRLYLDTDTDKAKAGQSLLGDAEGA